MGACGRRTPTFCGVPLEACPEESTYPVKDCLEAPMFALPTFRDMLVIVEDYAAENGIMRLADNALRWLNKSRRPRSHCGWWR